MRRRVMIQSENENHIIYPPSPPPPPPPPPTMPLSFGENQDIQIQRLSSKIHRQASELLELQTELDDKIAYITLCEAWIVANDPSVLLPLDNDTVESLATQKTGISTKMPRMQPKHTVASLSKQYESACKRITDQIVTIKELQNDLEESEKKRESLESKLSRFEDQKDRLRTVESGAKKLRATQDQLQNIQDDNRRLVECLEKENKVNEEQRVYLKVLQDALRSKALQLGLDGDQIIEIEKDKAEQLLANFRSNALDHSGIFARDVSSSPQRQNIRTTRASGSRKTNRPSTEEAEISESKDALDQLRKENEALIDYIRETVEPLKQHNEELQISLDSVSECLERTIAESTTQEAKLSTMESDSENVKLRMLEKDVEINAVREARDTALESASNALSRVREVEMLNGVLADTVKSKEEVIKKLEEQLNSLEQQTHEQEQELRIRVDQSNTMEQMEENLSTTQAAVAKERRARVVLEHQNAELENKLLDKDDELQRQSLHLQKLEASTKALEAELEEHEHQLESLHAQLSEKIDDETALNDTMETLYKERDMLDAVDAQLTKLVTDIAEVKSIDDILKMVDQSVSEKLTNVNVSVLGYFAKYTPGLAQIFNTLRDIAQDSSSSEARIRETSEKMEQQFNVEKQLLVDEVHSLRSRMMGGGSAIRGGRSEWYAGANHFEDIHRNPSSFHKPSDVEEFADATARGVWSRIDQQHATRELITSLRRDLQKATEIVQEQETLGKQLETKLTDTESELETCVNEIQLAKRLAVATLKGILIRYRRSHPVVEKFYVEQDKPSASDGLEHLVSCLCELLESTLVHKETDNNVVEPPRRKPRSTRRTTNLNDYSASIDKAQKLVDKAREKLGQVNGLVASELSEESSYSSNSGNDHYRMTSLSPTKVRVSRNGTIRVARYDDGLERVLEKTERARKSQTTPTSQRFRKQFRNAQERMRGLRSSAGLW